ncbi:MAG TPA: DUF4870 domain-containing protein [Candidatus Acidoferrum sp.]|nr:DUF4870 domain-containing protein [Candidatus Acidoferrum sp.]
MAFCSKCGAQLTGNTAFCASCGQSQGTARAAASSESGLSENAAATLSYALGWITGLVFLLIDKRPYVRFHAAQSLVTFGGLHAIRICLGIVFGLGFVSGGMLGWSQFSFGLAIISLLGLLSLVLWIVCMIKASQGDRFKLPVVGDIAENIAGK